MTRTARPQVLTLFVVVTAIALLGARRLSRTSRRSERGGGQA